MASNEQPFPFGLRSLLDELNSILLERIYQGGFVFKREWTPSERRNQGVPPIRRSAEPDRRMCRSLPMRLDS